MAQPENSWTLGPTLNITQSFISTNNIILEGELEGALGTPFSRIQNAYSLLGDISHVLSWIM